MSYDPLKPHWRETVAEYRMAARHARNPSPSYVIRWADGDTVAMSFWADGRKPVELQTARGRQMCLSVRRRRRGGRPDRGIMVEYAREMTTPEGRAFEREAAADMLAEGLGALELLTEPIWHRDPHAIYARQAAAELVTP